MSSARLPTASTASLNCSGCTENCSHQYRHMSRSCRSTICRSRPVRTIVIAFSSSRALAQSTVPQHSYQNNFRAARCAGRRYFGSPDTARPQEAGTSRQGGRAGWPGGIALPGQQTAVDFRYGAHTEQSHVAIEFLAEEFDRTCGAVAPRSGDSVENCAAGEHSVRAEGERLHHIRTSPYAAVRDQREVRSQFGTCRRQRVHSRDGPVELASAVIGQNDAVRTGGGGAFYVRRAEQAFNQQHARPERPDIGERVPVEG